MKTDEVLLQEICLDDGAILFAMSQNPAVQELARRFKEDEAIWQCFNNKRLLRESNSFVSDELLDEIAWRESEQECRPTRCIGKPLNEAIEAD
jgi:hypothetical protein